MVFHWSLSDSKSPQVSRTRLSILAVLSNAVVWIVSTRPPTSKSSRPFNNPLVIVPNAPITIGAIVTFMFHSFFNSLARSRYLSFFSFSFRFILRSAETAKSTILQILFFFLLIIMRSGLLAGIRGSVLSLLLYLFYILYNITFCILLLFYLYCFMFYPYNIGFKFSEFEAIKTIWALLIYFFFLLVVLTILNVNQQFSSAYFYLTLL